MQLTFELCCATLDNAKEYFQQICTCSLTRHFNSRIEICEHIEVGGVTPSMSLLARVIELWQQFQLKKELVTVHVLIRCREGNFFYSDEEVATMKLQIENIYYEFGDYIQGVVIGCLDPNTNTIHEKHLEQLCKAASKFKNITFHRAFDLIPQDLMISQLGVLAKYNINRILTSGCPTKAMDGLAMLKKLVQASSHYNISIIAAGTVRDDNVQQILDETKVQEVHSSCILQAFINQTY